MIRDLVSRVVVATILAGALVMSPMSVKPSQAQGEAIYLALGDSIPSGLLASLPAERGYPALLHELIEIERLGGDDPVNVEMFNLAEPGETVQSFVRDGQLEAALEKIGEIPEDSLSTVTMTLGGNNILSLWESTAAEREVELQQFQSGFADVISELESALDRQDADVVVTTYYDVTEGDPESEGSNAWWLRQFNEVIAETASEAGFYVVDLEELFRGRVTELTWFPADIHPNNAGHQAIARAIWQEVDYDQQAPEVEITRPESDEVRSRVPTIHATVSDNVGIDSVTLEVNGEEFDELLYVSERDAWIGLWDARDYQGIEAELSVVATDVSGNETRESVAISLPPG